MKFSLIIPTINRIEELENLLISIKNNTYKDYEIIIVDQNPKGYLDTIIKKFKGQFKNFIYCNVDFKGAARARNYGVKYATGDIVNFPDDDSEYTYDLLENVKRYFDNKNIDSVFGVTIDKKTKKYSCLKFLNNECKVCRENMFKTTIEATMFIKRKVFNNIGGYDETLGVGTKYGSDEGADLVLRLLYKEYSLYFSPNLIFYHPNKESKKDNSIITRGYTYGMGFGRLTAKHKYIYGYKVLEKRYKISILKCIVKIILGAIKFDDFAVKYNKSILKGRVKGFNESKKEYKEKLKYEG